MVKKAAIAVSFIVLFGGIVLSSAFAADPIKIGVLLPLSGRNAAIGQIQKNAVLMAAAEINARGGIKDRKIEPLLADTKGTPDGGRAAIRKLIQTDNVRVLGGGFSSSATWATGAIAQQSRIPFVVTSAVADKITEQGWDYVFRLNQPLGEHRLIPLMIEVKDRRFFVDVTPDAVPRQLADNAVAALPGDLLNRFADHVHRATGTGDPDRLVQCTPGKGT